MLLAGCEQSVLPGASCTRPSDCTAPLVCAVGRCRSACSESRDCPTLARCLVDPASEVGVCSLVSVDDCRTHDCALGFVCRDGLCLNECDLPGRCPDGACEDGVCVPTEVVLGDAGLPRIDAAATMTRTLTILEDADDGEIDLTGLLPQGEFNQTIYCGHGVDQPTRSYLRFTLPMALGPSARIVDLRLRLAGRGIWMGCAADDALSVRADDVSDAAQTTMVSDYPGGATGAAATTSTVAWGPLSEWIIGPHESPSLAPILQELIDDHGGLAEGAHVRLWLEPLEFTRACEVAFSDSAGQDHGDPELVVTWVP